MHIFLSDQTKDFCTMIEYKNKTKHMEQDLHSIMNEDLVFLKHPLFIV